MATILNKLGYAISLAHCNFLLRGTESNLDQDFVEKLAQKLSISIFTKKFDTTKFAKESKQSIQIAARNLRYQWFNALVKEHHFDFIVTGHHADDNLETFLINLTRGTGLEGFLGIPPVNNNIVRPMLVFSRNEIETYAKENFIDWREDQSNATTKYSRNKIRHQVIPALKEINPNLLYSFSKTLKNLEESTQIINDRIVEVATEIIEVEGKIIKFNISKMQQLPNPKAYLYQLLKEYNFTEWNDVYQLLFGQSGKKIVSKTHCLVKNREFLLLSPILENQKNTDLFTVNHPSEIITNPIYLAIKEVEEFSVSNKNTIYVAKELVQFPLVLRKWQHGDSFYPAGMQGKKKLSKYFKDEKMSVLEKEQIWLLCNKNEDIIWVINKRQDSRFLTKKTKCFKITTQTG